MQVHKYSSVILAPSPHGYWNRYTGQTKECTEHDTTSLRGRKRARRSACDMTTFTHGHCKVTKTHRSTTMIAGIDRRVPPCTFVVACLAHQAHLGPLPSLRTIVTHDPCMSKTATHAYRHRQNAISNRYRRVFPSSRIKSIHHWR